MVSRPALSDSISKDNILVDSQGHARIADFGTNVVLQYTGVVTTSGSKGTVEYKAPEIIEAESQDVEDLDKEKMKKLKLAQLPTRESDVYATSVLIWEVSCQPLSSTQPANLEESCTLVSILTSHRDCRIMLLRTRSSPATDPRAIRVTS
jgi:serine/threonine protein kinase